jgi:hypothetical protein
MRFTISIHDRITIQGRDFQLLRSDHRGQWLTPMPRPGQSNSVALPALFHIDRRHSVSTPSNPLPST